LSEWVFGKQATVLSTGKDRFKRTLAFIEVDDFGEVNKNLIADGLAWEYKKYSKSPTLNLFEMDARQRKLGLWSDPVPTAPWEWRTKNNSQGFVNERASPAGPFLSY
jgi:endonuclease YncB( thermonuclease family)